MKGFVKEDFTPISSEGIHRANELKILNNRSRNVIEGWKEIKELSKVSWLKRARKYPDVPNVQRLLQLVKEKKNYVEN